MPLIVPGLMRSSTIRLHSLHCGDAGRSMLAVAM